MQFKLPTWSKTRNSLRWQRGIVFAITILLLSGAAHAQKPQESPEEAAKRLMFEGLQLVSVGTPESLTKAIEKLEAARAPIQTLKLPAGEAAVLTLIGYAYTRLEQDEKAVDSYMQSLPLYRTAGEKRGEA